MAISRAQKNDRLQFWNGAVGKHSALYGTAVDFSGQREGHVKSVVQEGGLSEGYGLLKVETAKGTDLCFAAYRPGTYKTGGLETDAAQAMVVMNGQHVRAMYLGGGKTLKAAGATIERNESGLAYVRKSRVAATLWVILRRIRPR